MALLAATSTEALTNHDRQGVPMAPRAAKVDESSYGPEHMGP